MTFDNFMGIDAQAYAKTPEPVIRLIQQMKTSHVQRLRNEAESIAQQNWLEYGKLDADPAYRYWPCFLRLIEAEKYKPMYPDARPVYVQLKVDLGKGPGWWTMYVQQSRGESWEASIHTTKLIEAFRMAE